MKRERMMEFVRELGLDTSKTITLRLDADGWQAEQFLLDEDGKRVLSEAGSIFTHAAPVTGVWE